MHGRLQPGGGAELFVRAIESAMTPPWGPVQLDLTSEDATIPIQITEAKTLNTNDKTLNSDDLRSAARLLSSSKKPIILAGLEARHGEAPEALRRLADTLACPVLVTFKAAGVLPTSHPGYAGLFTGAVAESDIINAADLIVLFGFDAIEIIPAKWSYQSPILDLCLAPATPLPVEPRCRVTGSLGAIAESLLSELKSGSWTNDEIVSARKDIADRFALRGGVGTAQSVIETASDVAPKNTRLCVDAGAHMFAALAFWPTNEAFGVLKSDGLSTMGYALPAAIASALEEPERPVLAVTGDGGLMMCLSELTTAVERGCDITVAVINDAALSLIDIKQQRLQYQPRGVRYPSVDFAACAEAMGCQAWRVSAGEDAASALRRAFDVKGPALVDIACNRDGYGDQLAQIRG